MEQTISNGHTAKARLRSDEDWDVKLMGCKTSRREFIERFDGRPSTLYPVD